MNKMDIKVNKLKVGQHLYYQSHFSNKLEKCVIKTIGKKYFTVVIKSALKSFNPKFYKIKSECGGYETLGHNSFSRVWEKRKHQSDYLLKKDLVYKISVQMQAQFNQVEKLSLIDLKKISKILKINEVEND